MAVERKYERDIDLLLAEEFEVSEEFAAWFLGKTRKFAGVEASVSKVWVENSNATGESDLIVLFESLEGKTRFALHIEDKLNTPLGREQAKRYRVRAESEVLQEEYADYEVVLCSPQGYRPIHRKDMAFDSFVSYEEIGDFLKPRDRSDRRAAYRSNFLLTATARSLGQAWV